MHRLIFGISGGGPAPFWEHVEDIFSDNTQGTPTNQYITTANRVPSVAGKWNTCSGWYTGAALYPMDPSDQVTVAKSVILMPRMPDMPLSRSRLIIEVQPLAFAHSTFGIILRRVVDGVAGDDFIVYVGKDLTVYVIKYPGAIFIASAPLVSITNKFRVTDDGIYIQVYEYINNTWTLMLNYATGTHGDFRKTSNLRLYHSYNRSISPTLYGGIANFNAYFE